MAQGRCWWRRSGFKPLEAIKDEDGGWDVAVLHPHEDSASHIQAINLPPFFPAAHVLGCMPPFCDCFFPSSQLSGFIYHLCQLVKPEGRKLLPSGEAWCYFAPPTVPAQLPLEWRVEAGRLIHCHQPLFAQSPFWLPFHSFSPFSLTRSFHPGCLLLLVPSSSLLPANPSNTVSSKSVQTPMSQKLSR